MAKNITLMGASYSDVPAVVLPQTGGGTARFDDASVTTATASDVAEGKVFLSADGTITTGSSSGGGGGGSPIVSITLETAVTTTTGMVALLTENISEWELNQFYFVSIEGNTATGQYKGLSCSIIRHSGGLYYGFLRTANLTSMVSDSYRFDISVGATVDIYKVENAIYPDPLQYVILRPDAELWKTWTYDKLIVADEGITIPAYSTTQQALKTSVRLEEITLDDSNYKYFVVARTLSIPIYNTTEIGKGRFEWGATTHMFEDVTVSGEKFKTLVDGSSASATSIGFSGGNYYRGVNYGVYVTPVTQTTNTYGTWQSFSSPSFGSGKLRINSPSFVMRGNDNSFSQQFWEATTDIRYQYVIELWRAPIGSLDYDGWQWSQSFDHILDCLYSNDHKLT